MLIVFSIALLSSGSIYATNGTENTTNLNSTSDLIVPTIKSIDPAKNAVNIATNKVITVTFSEAIKMGSGWIELLDSSGKAVPFTTSISDNKLIITPSKTLNKGTKYTISLHTGSVTDLAGNNLAVCGSTFTTDGTPPTITNTNPAKNAVNIPVNKVITVTFSEAIKMGSGWIELLDSSGKAVPFTTSINDRTLTITPNNNLTKGTRYTISLHTGSVTDLSGNNLAVCASYFTTDSTKPAINTIDPARNAVNIPVNKVITITFSEAIKMGSGWIELLNSGGKAVPFTTSISGTKLTITPNNNLTKGTRYTISLHTGSVTDLAGNNLAVCGSTFTTDSTPPVIKSMDPAKNAANIAANKVITVTFSEAIKMGSGWIELLDSGGKAVPFTTSISGTKLTITPLDNLVKGTKYTIALHTGSVTDLSGNNVASYVSYFIVDNTPPTMKSIDPAKNAVNVHLDKVITVTFSEAIKMGSGWIELLDSGGKAVPFTTSISGTKLTITPRNNLTEGTKYTLALHTGSIIDLAGNNLAVCTGTFTTSNTFTVAQIQDAAASVESYIETYKKLPSYVTIDGTQITMPQFLQMLVTGLLQIDSGITTLILSENVNSPTSPTGDYIYKNMSSTEYLNIAESLKNYIESNNRVPNYVTSSLGNIQYEALVYMYSKVLSFYKTNSRLPNYVTVDSSFVSFQQYLKATANCQVTDPKIKAKAADLTSGKTTTYAKAVAIYNWVRDHLAYSFYYNTKYGAVDTLRLMKGNCVDHSHLLIALLRAAGIPARYMHGTCTFTSGSTYGHVWAQVLVDGKWYNADATSTKNSFGVINNWNTATYTYKGTYASLPF